MNRKIKRYTWKHSPTQTLNGAIMYFQRYVKRTYGKKKINVLIDALLTNENWNNKVYTCLFEFKKARLPNNERGARNDRTK